ncbi:MAG: hypothetical protein U0M13_07735, partial [Desulfovibrio fairfieldensis]|nr:hypothetical protein [Desulfovibrio fairfieldensis]
LILPLGNVGDYPPRSFFAFRHHAGGHGPGDALCFESSSTHSYENKTDTAIEFIVVNYYQA